MLDAYGILGALVLAIVLLIVAMRSAYKSGRLSYSLSRKILHVGAIGISAWSVLLLPDGIDLIRIIVAVCAPLLFMMVVQGFFRDPDKGKRSWGIVYFAFAFLLLLVFFDDKPGFIFYPLLTLCLADGMATILGELYGKNKYSDEDDSKTVEGSLAFFFSCMICLGILPAFVPSIPVPFDALPAVLIASLALTFAEAIFKNGSDNLILPILVVYWMMLDLGEVGYIQLLISLGIIGLGVVGFKVKALNFGGAIAAVLMGMLLMISPNPLWSFPAIILFAVGTILSKMPGGMEKGENARSAVQVLANGAIPTLFIMLYFTNHYPGFLVGGIAGYAAALSDTASSEIGTRYQSKSYYLVSFEAVPAGLSGGVTLIGLAGGLVFSFLIAAVALNIANHMNLAVFAVIGLAGFAGNLVDSLIGAIWQVKYRSERTKLWADVPDGKAIEQKGHSFVTNDVVNFLAVLFASLLATLLFGLF